MIIRIISGGQTGVDRAGLEVAKSLGIETGGTAPLGYRTQTGPDLTLRDEFGLVESPAWQYQPRTLENVKNSDGTVLYGDMTSPGCKLTIRYCIAQGKPYITNPSVNQLVTWFKTHNIQTLNVAGNRLNTNPRAAAVCRNYLTASIQKFHQEI